MNENEAIEVLPPTNSRWIFDTMSMMSSLKVTETYDKCFDKIMKVAMPCEAGIHD